MWNNKSARLSLENSFQLQIDEGFSPCHHRNCINISVNICNLPPIRKSATPTMAHVVRWRWFFSPSSGTCQIIQDHAMNRTPNNFQTKRECLITCCERPPRRHRVSTFGDDLVNDDRFYRCLSSAYSEYE